MKRYQKILAATLLAAMLCLQASCGSPAARPPAPSKPAAVSAQPAVDPVSPTGGGVNADQPEATASATGGRPQAAAKTGAFMLCVFDTDFNQEQRDEFVRIQKALNDNGWRVSFMMQALGEQIYSYDHPVLIHHLVKKQVASGDALADGWLVPAGMASELVDEGIAQDIGDTLRQAAPNLFERFQALFERTSAGLPVNMNCRPYSGPPALYLREEYAKELKPEIDGIDDLLSLAGSLGSDKLSLSVQALMVAWADKKGFYSLSRFGMDSMLYAAYGDPECMPVPVESIAGFPDFLRQYHRLYQTVGFKGNIDQPRMDIAGYVGAMSKSPAYPSLNGERYVVYPLARMPLKLPDNAPMVNVEIAVSAQSSKAADIARCMQWLFTAQENYDAVTYGKPGIDYKITNNRLEMFDNGNPVSYDSDRYFRYRPFIFFNSMERVTVFAPVNYEEALASCRSELQPIQAVAMRKGFDEAVRDVTLDKMEFISKRQDVIWVDLEIETFLQQPEDDAVASITKSLEAMRGDTEALVNAYYEVIQQMQGQ